MEVSVDPSNTLKIQDFASLVLSFLALCVSVGTFFYAIRQVRFLRSQLRIDADLRVAAVNRELFTMAFHDAELFNLFEDKPLANKHKERHYVQMWFNHVHTMWNVHEHGLISDAEWYSDIKDIALFFSIKIVRQHWEESKGFFPANFVQFIASLKDYHPEVPTDEVDR